MNFRRDYTVGPLASVLTLFGIVALFLFACTGCAATGIQMSEEEAAACRAAPSGCSVWTESELLQLVQGVFAEGFRRGAQQKKERSL